MKHVRCALAFLIAILILAGCSAATPATTTQSTTATTAPALPEGIRNIIIVIGDGMGDAHLQLGEQASGKELVFRDWTLIHSNTNSFNSSGEAIKTTDSAAGGTALATGQLTTNGKVGRDSSGKDIKNIMEYAQEFGKSTGVISTDAVYGATPAAFSSHCSDRDDSTTIMYSQFASNINLFCANKTDEARELRDFGTSCGYTYLTTFSDINKNMDQDKLYFQLPLAGSSPGMTLSDILPSAMDYLDQDTDGFVLMVEQAHIDKYSHSNDALPTSRCVEMLDEAVSTILDWIGERDDTAVLITADHETGELALGTANGGYSSFTSSAGNEVYYYYGSTSHSQTPVSVYTYGFTPDWSPYYLDEEGTLIKNISVFSMMYELLENPLHD